MSAPEAPPSYAQATGSSTASSRLEVPHNQNGIPTSARRSMEDEQRPLPAGWVRQFDTKEQHQFFVDTKATPPRSIWHHPYDDEDYLKTLTSEERERIQEEETTRKMHINDNTTDDETSSPKKPKPTKSGSFMSTKNNTTSSSLPPHTTSTTGGESSSGRQGSTTTSKEKSGFGRKLKDKLTGTTHEERQIERARREEEERQYYEAHMRFREALQRAQMTGQPQFLAKDRDGKDVYVEPPQQMYGGGYGGGYGGRGYGYNPYNSGLYANPNARFIRPQGPYGRPYGSGYGGGMGMPIAGGLLGGMLLGGLLF